MPTISNPGPSRVDGITDAIRTIEYAHHEIHSGNHFKAGYQDVTMNTDDVIEILFAAPDTTKWGHWKLVAQSTGAATIEVFEGTTTSNDGTPVTRWNRNRNSATTSGILAYHTPTITSDGTMFATKWIGGTGFKADIGGESRGDAELVLKQNTKYLVRCTANADTIKCAIGGDWYEHTNL